MKISLLIASRGRPVELLRTLRETDKRIANIEDTTISVALDDDDDLLPEKLESHSHLKWDVAAREDSLGAKYNRAARNAPADIYILGADDNIFLTPGWDDLVREKMAEFTDGLGFVYFGRLDGALPTQMAAPHRLIEEQGFLFPEHFPVWFHDTWIDEIAHACGRILWAKIDIEEIGGRGKSRGVREVAFWAALFDGLRAHRLATAESLSQKFNPGWYHTMLMQRRDLINLYFADRISALRNPATALHFEKRMSFDAPADVRYLRIKSAAEETMREVLARVA